MVRADLFWMVVIAFFVAFFDLCSKFLVNKKITEGKEKSIIKNFLVLKKESHPLSLKRTIIVLVGGLIIFPYFISRSILPASPTFEWFDFGAGLIMGGFMGNLLDVLFHHREGTNIFEFKIPFYGNEDTNLADLAIFSGIAIVIVVKPWIIKLFFRLFGFK